MSRNSYLKSQERDQMQQQLRNMRGAGIPTPALMEAMPIQPRLAQPAQQEIRVSIEQVAEMVAAMAEKTGVTWAVGADSETGVVRLTLAAGPIHLDADFDTDGAKAIMAALAGGLDAIRPAIALPDGTKADNAADTQDETNFNDIYNESVLALNGPATAA